jgi:hypothetical protein
LVGLVLVINLTVLVVDLNLVESLVAKTLRLDDVTTLCDHRIDIIHVFISILCKVVLVSRGWEAVDDWGLCQ